MKSNAFESIIDKKTWKKGAAHVADRDKVMAGIIGRFGAIKFEWGRDGYEARVRSFISQQISNSAADSIFSRFMQLYGGRFPRPREFLETPEGKVRRAGISPQKYAYVTSSHE